MDSENLCSLIRLSVSDGQKTDSSKVVSVKGLINRGTVLPEDEDAPMVWPYYAYVHSTSAKLSVLAATLSVYKVMQIMQGPFKVHVFSS